MPGSPNPAMSSSGAMPSRGAMTSAPGQQKFAQGVHKDQTFSEVYDTEPQYTKWIIGRTEKGLTKDPVLEAYVKYARDRAASVALMAIVLVAVIDSGCNNACHGSIWMRHLQQKRGLSEADAPLEPVDGNFKGISGNIDVLGKRRAQVRFRATDKTWVDGSIYSVELKDSEAPCCSHLERNAVLVLP